MKIGFHEILALTIIADDGWTTYLDIRDKMNQFLEENNVPVPLYSFRVSDGRSHIGKIVSRMRKARLLDGAAITHLGVHVLERLDRDWRKWPVELEIDGKIMWETAKYVPEGNNEREK